MKKRSAKKNYLLLLPRDKQDLNRYNPNNNSQKKVFDILEQVVNKEGQKMYFLLDVSLQYAAANDQKYKEVVEEEEEESLLEADLEDVVKTEDRDEEDISLRYTPLDEQLLQMAFSYDHEEAHEHYDGLASKFSYEDDYESTAPANDNAESEVSLTEEVHETIERLKYDFLNPTTEISSIEAERLAMHIALRPGEYALQESLLNLNRDSDFGPI